MSANDWPEVSLIELQAPSRWALNGGPFGSKLVSRDYVDAGVPVIRGVNLPNSQRFSFDDFVFVSEDKADELLPNNAHPGDVVFTQRGTLGQVGIIPRCSPYSRFVISQSQMKITVDKGRVDPYWLFYAFRNPVIQQEMINRASTSGVPHINLAVLREFKLRLPPVQTQLRIASILSAYDDLIENNTRRIAILEEMARRIYEEWFVRFRFPGHENVRMVESELGLVPEGWSIDRLENIYRTGSGGTPSRKNPEYFGAGIPWVKTQELTDGFISSTEEEITDAGFENSSAKLFPAGTVLVAMYGATIGKLGVLAVPASTNQACCAVIPKDDFFGTAFAFLTLLTRRQELVDLRAGAAQQNINQVTIRAFPMCRPPKAVLKAFREIADPLLHLSAKLHAKNRNLRVTRDLLLPKLISGELDVSALPEPEVCIT